jgi:hypothetical protein
MNSVFPHNDTLIPPIVRFLLIWEEKHLPIFAIITRYGEPFTFSTRFSHKKYDTGSPHILQRELTPLTILLSLFWYIGDIGGLGFIADRNVIQCISFSSYSSQYII